MASEAEKATRTWQMAHLTMANGEITDGKVMEPSNSEEVTTKEIG